MLEVRMQSAYAPPPRKSACWKCACEAHMRYLLGNTHAGSVHAKRICTTSQEICMLEVLMRSAYALPPRKSACWKHAFAIHTCGRAKGCADDVFVAFASQNARPVFFAIQACGRANGRTDDVFEAFAFQNGNVRNSAFQIGSVLIPCMHIPGMRKCKRPH